MSFPIIELRINNKKYPKLLAQIHNPPRQLYCRGNIKLLESFCFSVVGTRKLTAYGKDVFSHSPEYALMTFFYDHSNQDNEKLYYQAVRKQAKKIHDKSIPSMGGSSRYKIAGGCLFTNGECYGDIPYSDTFGFAIATQQNIEGRICRYSVGLNPKGLE